ncbi:MAG: hypothetical protein ACYS18_08925 [Planctomycetota bacterium]
MRKGLILTGTLFWLVLAIPAFAASDKILLGDMRDGSGAQPVHLINLFDEEGQRISPDDELVLPFSMRGSCGACHDYEKISKGRHFNALLPDAEAGRLGQPWIYVDTATATQIPLSYRPWEGTYNPEQIGLTRWKFIKAFGRQLPGGIGEDTDAESPDLQARWMVSGELEINCLACHDGDPGYDRAEYATQVARENFRWAATAACGFASVRGSAKKMPETYDPFMPEILDDPKLIPPTVNYREGAFDNNKRVLLDIVKKSPDYRCYFCHSNVKLQEPDIQHRTADEDIHLAAGLTCVDCHRNGLDHEITRGYENEASVSANPLAVSSSCKGCHTEGRLGAPQPRHAGIPPVHFERLSCTACHSGLMPQQETQRIKTSRAHGLGTHSVNRSADALPHIVSPVFAEEGDGKIAPHNLIWSAFWGDLKDGDVAPIALELVGKAAGKILDSRKVSRSGDWPDLTAEQITKVLVVLKNTVAKPVYVCAGKVYSLDKKDQLAEEENSAAKPYLWPIAHDVRPAAHSLGSGGCSDCHTTDRPFFFGRVDVDSPLVSEAASTREMIEFQGLRPFYTKAFAFSFVFRPWLKIVSFVSCLLIAGVLLLYALKALGCVVKVLSEEEK